MLDQSQQRIRIATSIPGLKDKVQTRLVGATDVIYWYIRFNIPLDDTSVSDKTMSVTDTEGYIMRTDIFYNTNNNMIVISPLDTYEQNRFYLLNISIDVRSARGQNLRSPIHILFKLFHNQISDYKVLKQDVKVPKPKNRPKDYDARQLNRRITPIERAYMDRGALDQMKPVGFQINIWIGLIGVVLALIGIFLYNIWLLIVSAVVCVGGLIHIYIQMKDEGLSSTLVFNKGVRLFNHQRYRAAETAFKKALRINPDNKLAKYGLYKVGLYLE